MIYKVKGKEKYVKFLMDYGFSALTSAGVYEFKDLELVDYPVICISYNGLHVPKNFAGKEWTDDRGIKQKIKCIKYNDEDYPTFIMEDGYESEEVVGEIFEV